MKRRQFIKIAGITAGSISLSHAARKPKVKPKVYVAHDPKMVKGEKASPETVNSKRVRKAMDNIAKAMTGETKLGAAWEKLLPGITEESRVAIKVNCLVPKTSPQFASLEAMVKGLTSMFDGEFPAANISLFDNDMAMWGFKAEHVDNAFGKEKLDKLGIWHGRDTYEGPEVEVAGKALKVSTKWAEAGRHCINFLCPRPHLYYAGHLSGHIKNMMGAVSKQADKYMPHNAKHGGAFHDKTNFIGYFHLFKKYMKEHTQLYVSDMILIPKAENAYYDRVGNIIAMGTDPCAMDSHVVDILRPNYPKVTKVVPEGLAARKLGSIDYEKVEVKV